MVGTLTLGALLAATSAAAQSQAMQADRVAFWTERHGILIRPTRCDSTCRYVFEETVDGGRTWVARWRGRMAPGLPAVVPGGRRAFAGSMWTNDGGRTWRSRGTSFLELSFGSPGEGWAVAGAPEAARLYATADGGLTWRRRRLPARCADFELHVALTSVETGWLLCDGQPGAGNQIKMLFENRMGRWMARRSILTATDPQRNGGPGYGWGIAFRRGGRGLEWIFPARGLYVTSDGGRMWRTISLGHGIESVSSAGLLGPHVIYVLGYRPGQSALFLFSRDAGRRWRVVHRVP
jgi:hypothetical protein